MADRSSAGAASALGARVGSLVRVSARLAASSAEGWRAALREARELAGRTEIEEVLLQAHLFVGFPVVLNAFIVWAEEIGCLAEPPRPPAFDRRAAGTELCRKVYGKAYERLRENVRALSPDLDRWMVEDGYGKTLSRPGLSVEVRELCIVALLAAGGHERQLRAHLFGALNVGARPDQVEAALAEGVSVAAESRSGRDGDPLRLFDLWRDVQRKVSS